MQGGPRVEVDVAEVGGQPDLSAYTVELLVDQQEVWTWTGRGGLFVHLGRVHDAVQETVATTGERMAEDGGQEGFRKAVQSRDARLEGEALKVFAQADLQLVLEEIFGTHHDMMKVV